jgi:hypothetical protein
MKLAIIGSRNIQIDDLSPYIPADCDEIISGGARGVDTCAAEYARAHGLKLTEFLPDYQKFGRAAPIVRNRAIVDAADEVLAFWDGSSRGTKSVIDFCKKISKPCRIVTLQK